VLDRWIVSRLHSVAKTVTEALDAYDVVTATAELESLVENLSNWYVRLSRRRFWKGGLDADKATAYATLRDVLMQACRLLAPFVPFLSDEIYRKLRGAHDPVSVHLCAYPETDETKVDADLEGDMALARKIAALGHQARNQAQIKVRQPLSRVLVKTSAALSAEVARIVETELNVQTIEISETIEGAYEEAPIPSFRTLGPRLGGKMQPVADWIKGQSADAIREMLASGAAVVDIDGEHIELHPDDVTYDAVLPDGFAKAEEGGIELLLDGRIDDALRAKGLLREVVHRIQMARKSAGFEVTDRVTLWYEGAEELEGVVAANEEEVASEILATSIVRGMTKDVETTETIELDDGTLKIGLRRTVAEEG